MQEATVDSEAGAQVPVPADFEQPDRILYGLTARQVAIFANAGAVLWLVYLVLTPAVSPLVVLVGELPVIAAAAAVAVGRRDGISLDRWLIAAARTLSSPRALVAAGDRLPAAPAWAPQTARRCAGPRIAPLALPVDRIDPDGVVDLRGDGRVALTACSTVTVGLRSAGDRAAVVDRYARWLHGLAAPVQVVVSVRAANVDAYAGEVEQRAAGLPQPALARAASGYAQFLRWLAVERDPLVRRVTVAHRVGQHSDAQAVLRQAAQTAGGLSAVGTAARVLDADLATGVLVDACHAWGGGLGGALPNAVVTTGEEDLP
jgi:hypothetical protein